MQIWVYYDNLSIWYSCDRCTYDPEAELLQIFMHEIQIAEISGISADVKMQLQYDNESVAHSEFPTTLPKP